MNLYHYHSNFYTGTNDHPDTLTIFVKSKNHSFRALHLQASDNVIGYTPFAGTVSGMVRIKKAAKKIFNEMSKLRSNNESVDRKECWNAFKNLFRGCFEMLPLLGGVTLITFDLIRAKAFFKSKIQKELGQQEKVAGVAMDGKILLTVPLEQLDAAFSKSPKNLDNQFNRFSYMCLKLLKDAYEQKSKLTLPDLLLKLKKNLNT